MIPIALIILVFCLLVHSDAKWGCYHIMREKLEYVECGPWVFSG